VRGRNLLVLTGGNGGAANDAVGVDKGGESNGGGIAMAAAGNGAAVAVAVSSDVRDEVDQRLDRIREAKMKGYEGDACGECGNFTLLRNGTCLKCDTCGGTSGCS
jgi:ribonucleoside-diphosphate reductase alpha chain